MCSPKTRLSEQALKEITCFENIVLNDVLKDFKMEALPNFPKRSAVDKAFIHIKDTEFKFVSVVRYRGVHTYLLDMPKSKILMVGPNCRELAKTADKVLIRRGLPPVNVLKKCN